MKRFLRTTLIFLVSGIMTGFAFLIIGSVTGWLDPHNPHGPDWWRGTYLVAALCLTPAVAFVVAARDARRNGVRH